MLIRLNQRSSFPTWSRPSQVRLISNLGVFSCTDERNNQVSTEAGWAHAWRFRSPTQCTRKQTGVNSIQCRSQCNKCGWYLAEQYHTDSQINSNEPCVGEVLCTYIWWAFLSPYLSVLKIICNTTNSWFVIYIFPNNLFSVPLTDFLNLHASAKSQEHSSEIFIGMTWSAHMLQFF